jgi:carboxyl-terminal processing protease
VVAAAACLCAALGAFAGIATQTRTAGSPAHAASPARAEVWSLLGERYVRRLDTATLRRASRGEPAAVLGDPYTQVLSPAAYRRRRLNNDGRYGGIGVHIVQERRGARIDRVVPHGPAVAAGIRRGDLITAVDHVATRGLDVDRVGRLLRGPAGSPIRIVVRRSGRSHRAVVRRRMLAATVVRSRMVERRGARVGIASLTQFSAGAGARLRTAVRGLVARGAGMLVLDLRRNPGGFVDEAVTAAGAFLAPGAVVVRERGAHWPATTRRTHARPVAGHVPLAVLVDGESASSAEILTAALRDHRRAVVVGTQTFGKGVIQDTVALAGGGALKLTVAVYTTPAGASIDRRGLRPDVFAGDDGAIPGDSALDAAVNALRGRCGGCRSTARETVPARP